MWAFVRKVRQLPQEVQGQFKPSGLLDKFKKEFCEDRRETERTHTGQALDKLNELIAEKNTLTGTWNTSRLVFVRLAGADEEEYIQYNSAAHLL